MGGETSGDGSLSAIFDGKTRGLLPGRRARPSVLVELVGRFMGEGVELAAFLRAINSLGVKVSKGTVSPEGSVILVRSGLI